jgi:hypothetical protein
MHERVLCYAISLLGTKVTEMNSGRGSYNENRINIANSPSQSGIAFVEIDSLKNTNNDSYAPKSTDNSPKSTDNSPPQSSTAFVAKDLLKNTNNDNYVPKPTDTVTKIAFSNVNGNDAVLDKSDTQLKIKNSTPDVKLPVFIPRINLKNDNSNSDVINDLIIENMEINAKYNINSCRKYSALEVNETCRKCSDSDLNVKGEKENLFKEQENLRCEEREKLHKEWFEVNFILREAPTSKEGWGNFAQVFKYTYMYICI